MSVIENRAVTSHEHCCISNRQQLDCSDNKLSKLTTTRQLKPRTSGLNREPPVMQKVVTYHEVSVKSWYCIGSNKLTIKVCGQNRQANYLQWSHNNHHCFSNHWQLDGLFNHLFRPTSKKTTKPTLPTLCEGNPQKALPWHDVIKPYTTKHTKTWTWFT